MSGYTAAAIVAVKACQVILASMQAYLALTGSHCPASTAPAVAVANGPYDVILVGGGTAGAVISHRLSKTTDMKILVIEEGACPPMESEFPGLFTLMPGSDVDRQMNIYNDSRSCQHQKSGVVTAGKMLGGSSGLEHMIYVPPYAPDFDDWVSATNDNSYSYDEMLKYYVIGENVQDEATLAENSTLHGQSGPQILTKQRGTGVAGVIAALEELGSTLKEDPTGACTINYPLLNIGNDCHKERQSGVVSYLKEVKDNENLTVVTGATVTKIIFEGTVATGVEFNVSGTIYSVLADLVVLTAGAIKTPQLLMLSGVGNSTLMTSLGIDTVVDNPLVGQNLQDHDGTMVVYGLDNSTTSASSSDPKLWPTDMVINYYASSCNETITTQSILLTFPPNASGFLQLCGYGFRYENEICDAMYEYNKYNNIMLAIHNNGKPVSRGSVVPTTSSIFDDPIIKLNIMDDEADQLLLATDAMAFNEIVNTTAFKALGAELAKVGLCEDLTGIDFWKCYVLEMSSTMWHYSGTCAVGKVLHPNMTVIGTQNLMVGDASAMPSLVSGNIIACVRAMGEKCADIIATNWLASQAA